MSLGEPQLQHLLKRLEGESGMRRKVRLLAGSWSVLQELSPQQRERVALAVGNRWAWRNIENLFGNPEELSDNQRQVKSFFDGVRDADPDKIRKVGREIKEGGFATAAKHVLGAVEEVLDEENGDEDESRGAVEAVPELRPPAPAAPPEAPAPVIEVEASEPEPPEPELEQEAPVEVPSAAPPVVEPANQVAAESSRDKPEPEPESEPEPEARPEPDPEPALQSEPADSAVEPTPEEDTLFHEQRADVTTLSAVESLRVLRRLSSGQVSSTRHGRAALVGSLGSGWAARRAVSSLIRSRSAATLDEALALIRQLPTATQQTWCLGDLVQLWDLDDDARARVLATAPTESARNRLAHRARVAVDHPL